MALNDKIKQYLKDDVDTEQVESVLSTLISVDGTYLDNAITNGDVNVKSWLDKKLHKSIETFKTNTLPNMVNEQVQSKLNERKEETETQRMVREMKEQMIRDKEEARREKLLNKALQYASEKKIPTKFIHRFIEDDEEQTFKTIDEFGALFKEQVVEEVDERFQQNGRKVSGITSDNTRSTSDLTYQDVVNMSPEEIKKNYDKIEKWNKKQLSKLK